jgi:hypothetical protein
MLTEDLVGALKMCHETIHLSYVNGGRSRPTGIPRPEAH